jgi:hypothetical protein
VSRDVVRSAVVATADAQRYPGGAFDAKLDVTIAGQPAAHAHRAFDHPAHYDLDRVYRDSQRLDPPLNLDAAPAGR